MIDGNWLEGANPFSLAKPSPWWLKLVSDYDDQLVIMPSCKDRCYRLCRRVARESQLGKATFVTHTHPDTVQMINHGLVPVTTLVPWAVQSTKIIRDLRARDLERHGGAERVISDLEYREQKRAEQKERNEKAELDLISGDAYRSLKMRKGERVSLRRPSDRYYRNLDIRTTPPKTDPWMPGDKGIPFSNP